MNNFRLICCFALFMVFCTEYRCRPNRKNWLGKIRRFIEEASNVEPREKMNVNIQNISFEKDGEIVQSYEHESLALIVNEHSVQRTGESSDESSSQTRVYHQFIIKTTNSDSTSEPIFSFWSMQIRKFVYFVTTGSYVKLIIVNHERFEGIIAVDFLNPDDAQLFWNYASSRNRTRSDVIDVLRFEIFNRQTKEKVEDLPFAVIHKELCHKTPATFTISLESDRVTQTPLLIFSAGSFSVSEVMEDRIGLLVSDEPNMVFILRFSPFENDAAFAFQRKIYSERSPTLDPIPSSELRAFID